MKRLFEFLRSVFPPDPWQFVYLAGAVFLFLSPRLALFFGDVNVFAYVVVALIPLIIAGIFAYYGCFQAGARPLRRIGLAVFLPAFLSFGLMIGGATYFNEKNQSILTHRPGLSSFFEECVIAWKAHPPGFSLALIALGMLTVFAIRMHLGISSLPLRLESVRSKDEPAEPWAKTQMLIFVLVCPLFLIRRVFGALLAVPSWWYRAGGSGFSVYLVLAEAINAALLVLLAILILGEPGRKTARSSLQPPASRFALFGLMLPVFISFMISSLQYGYDRAQWATHEFGITSPPQFTGYFPLRAVLHWAPLLTIFAVFAEEIVFRGILLRPLVQRYGLYRGIFFTGLIWAAFHFHGEMRQRYSMEQALIQLASRIAICLAMNYALSWMTLRFNSVIPAGIAHTVSNVLLTSRVNGGIPLAHEMRIALWAACALVLFRYWPPSEVPNIGSKMPAEIPIQPEASQL